MAARSSTMRRLFSSGARARPIQQKRETAKDKRRNEARVFAVNGVCAQRANHDGDQDRRGSAPVPWNQHTEPAEDFKRADDISSVGRVAPMRQSPGPFACRGACKFRDAGPDNTTASKMANAHTAALGSLITMCPPLKMASLVTPLGIGPSGARKFNSQNLNSDSQTVMHV